MYKKGPISLLDTFCTCKICFTLHHQVFILSGGTKNKCGKTIDFDKKDKQAYEFECEFVIADQVKIEQKGGFLTLCEVEVYGKKAKGKR